MDLIFIKRTDAITTIVERLKQLSLAYTEIHDETADGPLLKDGKKVYCGIDKMNEYIDQLDREKEQWYYCDC